MVKFHIVWDTKHHFYKHQKAIQSRLQARDRLVNIERWYFSNFSTFVQRSLQRHITITNLFITFVFGGLITFIKETSYFMKFPLPTELMVRARCTDLQRGGLCLAHAGAVQLSLITYWAHWSARVPNNEFQSEEGWHEIFNILLDFSRI